MVADEAAFGKMLKVMRFLVGHLVHLVKVHSTNIVILTVNGQSFHPMYMSFSKSGRRNNAKSAFQYTVNNKTT